MADEAEKAQKKLKKKHNNEKAEYYKELAEELESHASTIKGHLNKVNINSFSSVPQVSSDDVVSYKYGVKKKKILAKLKTIESDFKTQLSEVNKSAEEAKALSKKFKNVADSVTIDD